MHARYQFSCLSSGFYFGSTKAVTEFLNAAAHVVHGFLRASVKRMRLARRVQFVQRQLATVFHLQHFFGVDAGTGDEFEVVGQVQKADIAVIGVNCVFHFSTLKGSFWQPLKTILSTFLERAIIPRNPLSAFAHQ